VLGRQSRFILPDLSTDAPRPENCGRRASDGGNKEISMPRQAVPRGGHTKGLPLVSAESSIVERFRAVVSRVPFCLAVQDSIGSLTYAELDVIANKIAAATIAATKGRKGPIAILLRASTGLPAAIIGVLAAGRAYVALDPDVPNERNALIISESNACAVISTSDVAALAQAYLPDDLPLINIHCLPSLEPIKSMCSPSPDDLAAIYYTSGSSGVPKGVAWSHRSIIHWIQVFTEIARISHSDRMALLFSPTVSASYRAIYSTLLNGASLHVLPPLELGLPALLQEIRRRGITIYHSVPSLMLRIAGSMGAGERLDTVRLVCIGGDRVGWNDVDGCRRVFAPDVQIYSVLTSTEAGPFAHGFIEGNIGQTVHPLVGRPACGWKVTLAHDDGSPVAAGQLGEMIVVGPFIGLGYWRGTNGLDPFPADVADPKARVFRTGDLGVQSPDGSIEYVGRRDQQIKLSGHRIELGDVESALKSCDGVRDAAVVVRRDQTGAPQLLAAYCEIDPAARRSTSSELRGMLTAILPLHMMPKSITIVDALPRLPSFKIDREELQRRDAVLGHQFATERTPALEQSCDTQQILLELWRDALNRPEIGLDDDFFLSGGDSLSAVDLFARIEKKLKRKLPLTVLTEAPTVRLLETCIRMAELGHAGNMVRVHVCGKRPPLFVVHGVHGHTIGLLPTLRWLGPDQPAYGLQPPRMDWASAGCKTLQQAAAYFVQQVKAVQPHGPYRLLGTSFGAVVVFEMALQLQRLGEEVEYLTLVDAQPPACRVDGSLDRWPGHNIPQLQQSGPIESLHFRVYQTHQRMMQGYLLDNRLEQDIFRGELTFVCCMGNPILADGDRRRLWQHFAWRFRLLPLHGPHDVAQPGSDPIPFRSLLRASLDAAPTCVADPSAVFDRKYRIGIRHWCESILGSRGDVYPIIRRHSQGNIDGIFIDPESIQFKGWALEPCRTQRANTIAVFLDGRFLGYGGTGERRPDVQEKIGAPSVLHAGFNFHFRHDAVGDTNDHAMKRARLFILSEDGTAAELTRFVGPADYKVV
jgi:amino acid adenylation domain-containing protein